MNKRGQFEIQFNWIFVLVAGALILLLFSVIMLRGKASSDKATDIRISENIEQILASAESSKGTLNSIDIPKTEINFECEGYRIGDYLKKINILSVFTPSSIKSNKLVTWTLDWNLPYRVTNFIYLTSPETRYVLIGDSDLSKQLEELMPDNSKGFNKAVFDSANEVVNRGGEKVRLIFFDEDPVVPGDLLNSRDNEVSALKVSGDNSIGYAEFYEKDEGIFQSRGQSFYYNLPSLIGAIFSEDKELYECVMKRAFKKLRIVTSIYQKRTGELKSYYGATECANYYNGLKFAQVISAAENFDYANIQSLKPLSVALENQNKMAQRSSCPLIY